MCRYGGVIYARLLSTKSDDAAIARRDRRLRTMNHPRAPTAAIAARPQPTPMPAAAPPLRLEEALDGDGDACVALAASAAFVDEEPSDADVALDEGELDAFEDADPVVIDGGRVPVVVLESTVAVSKRSRLREIA